MVKLPPKLRTSARHRLLFMNHETNPAPINTTTLFATQAIAEPKSSHPHHTKTARRLQQFDPTKLHWTVVAPVDLSKSAFVRGSTARRYREAFRTELQREGWNPDGQRRPEGGPHGRMRSFDLCGALSVILVKNAFAVTATAEEVRESASWAVRTLYSMHKKNERSAIKDTAPRRSAEQSKSEKTQGSLIRRTSLR